MPANTKPNFENFPQDSKRLLIAFNDSRSWSETFAQSRGLLKWSCNSDGFKLRLKIQLYKTCKPPSEISDFIGYNRIGSVPMGNKVVVFRNVLSVQIYDTDKEEWYEEQFDNPDKLSFTHCVKIPQMKLKQTLMKIKTSSQNLKCWKNYYLLKNYFYLTYW